MSYDYINTINNKVRHELHFTSIDIILLKTHCADLAAYKL